MGLFQHGFVKGRWTLTNFLLFNDHIFNASLQKHQVDAVNIYFYKAFDKVNHTRLLQKVWNSGVKGMVFKWIPSYLVERKQAAKSSFIWIFVHVRCPTRLKFRTDFIYVVRQWSVWLFPILKSITFCWWYWVVYYCQWGEMSSYFRGRFRNCIILYGQLFSSFEPLWFLIFVNQFNLLLFQHCAYISIRCISY